MKGNVPFDAMLEADQQARAQGQEAQMMPVVAPAPYEDAVLPMKDAYDFFTE